jgi:hypothetical protein
MQTLYNQPLYFLLHSLRLFCFALSVPCSLSLSPLYHLMSSWHRQEEIVPVYAELAAAARHFEWGWGWVGLMLNVNQEYPHAPIAARLLPLLITCVFSYYVLKKPRGE